MGERSDVYSEPVYVLVDPSIEEHRSIIARARDVYITLNCVLVVPSTHLVDPEGNWEEGNVVTDDEVNDDSGLEIDRIDAFGRFRIHKKLKNVHPSVQYHDVKFKINPTGSTKSVRIALKADRDSYCQSEIILHN